MAWCAKPLSDDMRELWCEIGALAGTGAGLQSVAFPDGWCVTRRGAVIWFDRETPYVTYRKLRIAIDDVNGLYAQGEYVNGGSVRVRVLWSRERGYFPARERAVTRGRLLRRTVVQPMLAKERLTLESYINAWASAFGALLERTGPSDARRATC